MKIRLVSRVILMLLILTGCNPQLPETPNLPTTLPTMPETTQTPADPSSANPISPINTLDSSEITPPPPEANPFVNLAEEDLAARLKTAMNQVHFLKMSEIDWQDIRQGCTSPAGQTLTKGRVSGYRIWLEVHGTNYLYHIGLDNTVLFCPDAR